MALDRKLEIWGKDKIVKDDGKTHAEDYYCVKCYREKKEVPAVGFFPNFDLDILFFPYCKEHIERASKNILFDMTDEGLGID